MNAFLLYRTTAANRLNKKMIGTAITTKQMVFFKDFRNISSPNNLVQLSIPLKANDVLVQSNKLVKTPIATGRITNPKKKNKAGAKKI